jgi:hypothetical protein
LTAYPIRDTLFLILFVGQKGVVMTELMFAYRAKYSHELDFLIIPSDDLKWFDIRNSTEIWGKYVQSNLTIVEKSIEIVGQKIGLFVWLTKAVDPFTEQRITAYLENLVHTMYTGETKCQ